MDRDERGRFVLGNAMASVGGRARAAKLSPEQRSAIALMGFWGLVNKRFDGNKERALFWLSKVGFWGYDQPYVGTFAQKATEPKIEEF